MIAFLTLMAGCAIEPQTQTWLMMEPLDAPADANIVFADNTWGRGDVGTLGGDSLVQVEGVEVQISLDRGETWTNVAPTPVWVDVATAGGRLILIEAIGNPVVVQFSDDLGQTWTQREFSTDIAGFSQIMPNLLVMGTGADERVALHLDSGRVETLDPSRVFDGPYLIAPNGLVVKSTPWWERHRSLVDYTDTYDPEMYPTDYQSLRATFPLKAGDRAPEVLGFTTDSRLMVKLDDGVFVTTDPLTPTNDASAQALAGPGCELVDTYGLTGESDSSVTVNNGAAEAIVVFRWQREWEPMAVVEPGESTVVGVRTGDPVLAERLDGTCLEAFIHTEDVAERTVGTP